jgi:hypothetical protein
VAAPAGSRRSPSGWSGAYLEDELERCVRGAPDVGHARLAEELTPPGFAHLVAEDMGSVVSEGRGGAEDREAGEEDPAHRVVGRPRAYPRRSVRRIARCRHRPARAAHGFPSDGVAHVMQAVEAAHEVGGAWRSARADALPRPDRASGRQKIQSLPIMAPTGRIASACHPTRGPFPAGPERVPAGPAT